MKKGESGEVGRERGRELETEGMGEGVGRNEERGMEEEKSGDEGEWMRGLRVN